VWVIIRLGTKQNAILTHKKYQAVMLAKTWVSLAKRPQRPLQETMNTTNGRGASKDGKRRQAMIKTALSHFGKCDHGPARDGISRLEQQSFCSFSSRL
jgi:hypothetical protein